MFCEEFEFPAETLFELGEHTGEFHSGLRIPCNFCDDIYTTKKELEEHEMEVHKHSPEPQCIHSQKEEIAREPQEAFKCKFCGNNFQSKRELMKHNKDKHREKLKTCWNFEKGVCYLNNDCRYSQE